MGKMQCLSTADSSSSTRACCTCNEQRFCPFRNGGMLRGKQDAGYCGVPCGYNDANCKALAAGCGVSVVDASQNWGGQQFEWDIAHGQCNLCREPLWCNAEGSSSFGFNGAVQGDDDWWEMFGTSDGGLFKGSRQCKWKPSQQQEFIGSIRRRARAAVARLRPRRAGHVEQVNCTSAPPTATRRE